MPRSLFQSHHGESSRDSISYLGFTSTRWGAICLANVTPMEKLRGSTKDSPVATPSGFSETRTLDLQVASPKLYH